MWYDSSLIRFSCCTHAPIHPLFFILVCIGMSVGRYINIINPDYFIFIRCE